MRKVLLFLLLSTLCATAAHVRFALEDFTTQPVLNRWFEIKPLSAPSASGSAIVGQGPIYTNISTGTIIVSNMLAGTYYCVIDTEFEQTKFRITIPTTNVLINASDYLSTSTAIAPGTVAYSIAASDGRFVLQLSGNSSNQTLSSAVFYPGTNGVAWSVADSSQLWITNSVGHLLNSSWIFQGISTLGMDSGAVIYDYPGSSKTWNFKATANGNTVARMSDLNGATNSPVSNAVDVATSGLSEGSLLYWNNATQKWTNNPAPQPTWGVLFPKDGSTVLYAFGDSQTAGYNFSGHSYSDGTFIFPQYRWVNLLASSYDCNLVVSNCGIGASRISFGGAASPPSSIFNSMGRLTNDWKGVTTILAGWNDLGNYTLAPAFFETMTHAYEAAIARALIDDYFAITFLGWTRTSFANNDTPSWASSGGNFQWTTTDRDSIPFWFVSGGSGAAARYSASYTGAQTNQFLVAFKKAVGLFFDTTPNSGDVYVLLNQTNFVGKFNLNTSAVDSAAHFPYVVWIDNLPTNALITLTNNLVANKTNLFLAAGYVNYYAQRPNRTVILGTTTADTNSIGALTTTSRALTNLYSLAKAAESAGAGFADLGYPVYLANTFNGYVNATDVETNDYSHFSPVGHQHVFQAFRQAYRASGYGSSNMVRTTRPDLIRNQ